MGLQACCCRPWRCGGGSAAAAMGGHKHAHSHHKPHFHEGNGIFDMLVWPITMSLRVIFYPAHLLMYLIVNVIGANIKVAKYLEKDQSIAYKMPRVYFFT